MKLLKLELIVALRDKEKIEEFIESFANSIIDSHALYDIIYNCSSCCITDNKQIDFPDPENQQELEKWNEKSTQEIDTF